ARIVMNANSAINIGTGTVEAANTLDGEGAPPVGYWKLDENSGTSTTADSSGNGHTGNLTSVSESMWGPGKVGSTIEFNGSSSYVSINDTPALSPTTAMTVSFWAYQDSLVGNKAMMSKWTWQTQATWAIQTNNSTPSTLRI